jgi:hypothetical protein
MGREERKVEMVEVKTSELVGAALDWAVAQAVGKAVAVKKSMGGAMLIYPDDAKLARIYQITSNPYMPSENWEQGGKLIEEYTDGPHRNDELRENEYIDVDEPWYCESGVHWDAGPTPLIAACRCIVKSKLGETVQVPAELTAAPAASKL